MMMMLGTHHVSSSSASTTTSTSTTSCRRLGFLHRAMQSTTSDYSPSSNPAADSAPHRRPNAAATTGNSKRPNILFIYTDQQRADWFEMNRDIPVRTPHLHALSKRGVWLPNTVTPSPICAPARSCVWSGREYHRCRVWDNHIRFPSELWTYHRRLRDEAGYHVVGCGKFHTGKNVEGGGTEVG